VPSYEHVQLSIQYTDAERHSAQHHRRTDGRTDDSIIARADHSACSTIS